MRPSRLGGIKGGWGVRSCGKPLEFNTSYSMSKTIKSPLRRDPARNKKFKVAGQIFIILVLVFILILPYFVFADDPDTDTILGKLELVAGGGGYNPETNEFSFAEILGLVVSGFLSLLGVIFIGEIIYAGYNWMTAKGEEEKVERARETIRRAVIGLVVIVAAYAINYFVFYYLFSSE